MTAPTPAPLISGFSVHLRAIRQSLGWTQERLARKAGMPTSAISHYESGRRSPSLDNLVQIADALDVSIDLLLGRSR